MQQHQSKVPFCKRYRVTLHHQLLRECYRKVIWNNLRQAINALAFFVLIKVFSRLKKSAFFVIIFSVLKFFSFFVIIFSVEKIIAKIKEGIKVTPIKTV